jgi:hypothetical protein
MKTTIIAILVFICSAHLFGQTPDSEATKTFPRHYISVNPLKCALFQQAGLSYEYRPGRFGYELSAGYIYPSTYNFGRFFIARTANHGALEFYEGFFIDPQLNFYLTKPKHSDKGALPYLAIKGVYKYMFLDSTRYHIWDNSGGDYYWTYRKQVDRLNIMGGFVMFGIKLVRNHFFFDFNIGPGMLAQNHNLVIAGEGSKYLVNHNTSNVNPPREQVFNRHVFTMTMSLKLGVAF